MGVHAGTHATSPAVVVGIVEVVIRVAVVIVAAAVVVAIVGVARLAVIVAAVSVVESGSYEIMNTTGMTTGLPTCSVPHLKPSQF